MEIKINVAKNLRAKGNGEPSGSELGGKASRNQQRENDHPPPKGKSEFCLFTQNQGSTPVEPYIP